MPKLDGTGPMGYGPATGRGMGPCCQPASRQGGGAGWGRGFGRGYGRGMGYGWNAPQMTKKEQTEWLTQEAEALEDELKVVREEIAQLKKEK